MKTEREINETITDFVETGKLVVDKKLSARDLLSAKESALRMARDINPNTTKSNNQGMLEYVSHNSPPSVDKIIKDAKVIYDWLTA